MTLAYLDTDLPPLDPRADDDRLREYIARHLKRMANHGEQAIDYARIMVRSGSDANDELDEMETAGRALQLMAQALKREARKD